MIRIRDLTLRPGESQSRLHALAAKALKLSPAEISRRFLNPSIGTAATFRRNTTDIKSG